MAKTDIKNFLVEVSFFEGDRVSPVQMTLAIDTAEWNGESGVKEYTILHCANKLAAIRSAIGMPNALPKFKTFKVLRVTKPSDLAW